MKKSPIMILIFASFKDDLDAKNKRGLTGSFLENLFGEEKKAEKEKKDEKKDENKNEKKDEKK